MSCPPLHIVAIPTEIANAVRETMQSPGYGHPAHVAMATGYGPCRHCLEPFSVNQERRILFTYDSFRGRESLPLPGPVFIHERACERFPANGGVPRGLLTIPMTLNAYRQRRQLIEQAYAHGPETESVLDQLFAREDVDYVQVRNTEAGCFMFHAERAAS